MRAFSGLVLEIASKQSTEVIEEVVFAVPSMISEPEWPVEEWSWKNLLAKRNIFVGDSVVLTSLMTDNICHPKFNREFQHTCMQEEISADFCTEVG